MDDASVETLWEATAAAWTDVATETRKVHGELQELLLEIKEKLS